MYARLREWIVLGHLAPGEPLTETALAQSLRTSRTPVREALGRLHNDGLVDIEHGRGARVSEVSLRQAIEVYEIRELVESHAGRVAAASLRPDIAERLRQVREIVAAPSLTSDTTARWQLDCKLHNLILEAAENATVRDFIWALRMRTERAFVHLAARGLGVTQREHLKIIDALLAGDPDATESLIREHLANSRVRLTASAASAAPFAIGEPGGKVKART